MRYLKTYETQKSAFLDKIYKDCSPFINELKIPAFIVPMVNPDNNQHSPNENLKIGQIAYGIEVFYGILSTPLE